ncbi:MAG: hypothetical protein ACRDXX_15105 [Stackebrandtia sp.]
MSITTPRWKLCLATAAAVSILAAPQIASAAPDGEPTPTLMAEWQVTGMISDGDAHGWPLYAKLSFEGIDDPIFTDPATGYFSEVVPEGDYTVVVESLYAGYQAAEMEVSVTGGDVDASSELPLSGENCKAPGYRTSADGRGCDAVDGGMVIGHVLADEQPHVAYAVDDAVVEDTVTGVTSVSRATPDDAALRDGFYSLFTTATGDHEFEIQHPDWPAVRYDVDVVAGELLFKEFYLYDQ